MNVCLPAFTAPGFIKIEKPKKQLPEITSTAGELACNIVRQDPWLVAFLEPGHDRLGKRQCPFRTK